MASSSKIPWASLRAPEPRKKVAAVDREELPKPAFSPTLGPYTPGDPIPSPVATEEDTDTAWAMFRDLAADENRKFSETLPASNSMRLSPEERSYAPTVPAALQPQDAFRPSHFAPARQPLSVGEVIVEARRNNRVCPQPAFWQQLYDMLPDKQRSQPPVPMVGDAWLGTPSIPKRVCLRQHIEWADEHGALEPVFAFMKGLSEDQWLHMGD